MGGTPSATNQVKEKHRSGTNVLAHLVWQDIKSNLRPVRAVTMWTVAVLIAYREVKYHDGSNTYPSQEFLYYAEGALSRNHHWLLMVIPLFAGLMGAALAVERRTGVTLGILTKGVERRQYLTGKLMGAAASASLITLATILGFFAIVFTTWTPGRAKVIDSIWLAGPVEALFVHSPLMHDLLVALMAIASAAGLAVMGVLVGGLVANEYVTMAVTPIFTIISIVITRQVCEPLNPERYILLDYDFYFKWIPNGLIPFAPFMYWGTFAMIISFICHRIFAKKEIT